MLTGGRQDERRIGIAIRIALLVALLSLFATTPSFAQGVPGTCSPALGTADLIDHDFGVSSCELCGRGTVRIEIENPFGPSDDLDFSDLVLTEDLRSSGLTYVAGTTVFTGTNITVPASFEPTVGGPAGSLVTWDFTGTGLVLDGRPGGAGNRARLFVEFQVERDASVTEEGLVSANRGIEASLDLTPSCAPADRFGTTTGVGTLPLDEPEPQVIKLGRNVDAGQGVGSYSDPVYGHAGDDVIWRIEVQNGGDAPLQDFVFSDSIVPGNFTFDFVCDTETGATTVAGGGASADCVSVGGVTDVLGLDVAATFGGGANPYIVAPANGSGFYYLVGEITDSCTNRTNTVSGVEWGCQSEPPPGGISATSGGLTAGDDALLSTLSVETGVDVDVALTGISLSQPMGATGTVTITITNNSGGTIKGDADGMRLRNLLPAEYVIDPTFTPTITTTPAYGASYPGMMDTVTWTNPVAGTFPLVTADPLQPLANTDLEFELTSSTVHPDFPTTMRHMIRHGDVVRIRFRTVLIDPTWYDYVANLDVREEDPSSSPPGTDPVESFPIADRAEIWFDEFCTATEHQITVDENSTARPEDLDVDMSGAELIFILTNTGDPLPLTVALRNRGGHNADDYALYVTFGEAMVVTTVPAGCSATTNPPARPPWQIPVALPTTASVYVCDRGVLNPGETELLNFEVVKNTAASFDDDLTFRADVIGEITLSDGTPLWFPTPTARTDGITDRANDYSVDAVWARVIGYNLFKDQLGICTENNPPPGTPDDEIQIGEECSFHVESGGWFGFETPGFTYIAVQNIRVIDNLPNGQGYISSTNPLATSTAAIQGVTLNPPPAPLDETPFDWTFNTIVPGERITEKDHWFRVDVTTRLLNDPIDSSASPNQHAAQSSNVMTSTFDAVFFNDSTMAEELYTLGPNTIGFPREVHRRVDLTVTEPNLLVTTEVCNETRYGIGAACTNFVPLADDGDAFDTYVYRVTVENEAASGGFARAPAYDVTVTTVTDPSDQLFVDPLTGDTLDNDADTLVDGADGAGEGSITDNVLQNGTPAQVVASYTHSDALLRIDAGDSVQLYFRVDPDDRVAPLQSLVSTATAAYDSLEGASGAQTAPQGANGEAGGARQYVSAPGAATIRIIPVEVSPKQILRVSNSTLVLPTNPQPVSIGEEVEFQIQALIPVAQLRNFTIRDELPAGLSCAEAPAVDLDAPPYDAAGFVPGGVFTPTCTDTEVVWSFGDQTVTQSDRVDRRFDFMVQFIARVDNVAGNQEAVVLRNGGTSTVTEVRYVDEASNTVVLAIDEAALVVREPVLELTKTFSVATVDAADRPRVTVTLTNTGTATAYNPRVLEDLSSPELSYVGDIAGATPPTADLLTLGADFPLFSWAPGFAIPPGDSVSFSFAVEVALSAEPEQLLSNTIESDWTSLPSTTTALNTGGSIAANGDPRGMRNGALPNAGDPVNDYEATVTETVPVAPVTVVKTDLDPLQAPEIGSHRSFQIEIGLPEGTTQGLRVEDVLDSGSVGYVLRNDATYDITYEFVGLATINGLPPDETAFTAVPVDGTTGTGVWTIGTVVTASEDDLAASLITPALRIRYRARIENDLATNVGSTLQNTATVYSIHGETGLETSVQDASGVVTVTESDLTATKILSNVTSGKAPTDPPAFGDLLQYVVTVVNGGNATAYDVNVVDTLPGELELDAGFTPTATVDAVPVVGFVATPTGAPAGPLVWGRQNGDDSIDIPAGSFLELTYRVEVTSPPADGAALSNSVWIDWTSLQVDPGSVYERTGAGCPTTTPPNDYCYGPAVATGTVDPAPAASPIVKANTQATAAVGEVFRYRLTIPQTPYAFDAFDVRILDDLTASAADLRFLSVTKVSGSAPWTPANTGTATDLVIEDATVGIDIPAGEQIVFDIEVVLEDTPTNVAGLTFTNTANYVYRWLDGNSATERTGAAGTSAPMTIVEPDVTMTKSGPATMTLATPATFTLDLANAGGGAAWNVAILDRLPDGPNAGVCDTAPANVTAQVFESDGTTPVSGVLVEGTDYSLDFQGVPTCELRLAMQTAATTIGPGQRLIVTYESVLDVDSQNGETLENIAGATSWWSADGSIPATSGDRRETTRTLSDGTIGTLDHEDAFTTTVALPDYRFEKTVANVTRGDDPAIAASPGDRLRYRLFVQNLRNAPLDALAIQDELDGLNTPAVFVPGSLTLTVVPAGADVTNTDPTGGAAGTGLVDIRGLSLPLQNDSLVVEFEATLAPVIANGTVVLDQARLSTGGVFFAESDDPVLNGPADPFVPDDEDPTGVPIESAPDFVVEKVSSYVTGDPAVLLAGETLRYTITIKNVGSDDASDATLRDAIPVNTTYLPGSTMLNGVAVADGVGGAPPFATGLLLSAPEDPTPGAMRADASATTANVATLVFDVVVDPGAADGTVISNQAFVSAAAGGVVDQPSDDPRTVLPDDPTRDVVGNSPLLFAPKSVALLVDGGAPGVVDPGDTLRYTITVYNSGAVDATATTLIDSVPANTTWVADSLTLNGLPVGQPDGGVSPLASGIPIASSDLTPPIPLAGAGRITAGGNAVVQFDLLVNPGTPGGTIISNQATVGSAELPNLLTDGDGNPATGPEPTQVVVGNGQQLAITKQVAVVGGGAALPGSRLEYTVRVQNIGAVAATNVLLTDDLTPLGAQLTYVPGSATLDGTTTGVSVVGALITADHSTSRGPLAPGGVTTLRFRADLAPGLAMGDVVTNTAMVQWNTPAQTALASVSISVGGMPGVGALNGRVWHDADFDQTLDPTERALAGWIAELRRNGVPIQTGTTDATGAYRIMGVAPNDVTGDAYTLVFRAPDAGAGTAALGRTNSIFTDGLQVVSAVVVTAGSNLQDVDLPIDPNGVVYDSVLRTPIGGATVRLLDAGSQAPVAASCFDDPAQQGQVTGADGYYKFHLNFGDASCPSGGTYQVEATPPGTDFVGGISQIIPPSSGTATPYSVPACPLDAIPAPVGYCEIQDSELAPAPAIAAGDARTNYFLHLVLDASAQPGSSQAFNNHIPLDPVLGGAVAISKTTPSTNVSRGVLVPYQITLNNTLGVALPDLSLRDVIPAGFRYVEGSTRVDGQKLEPTINGRELLWPSADLGGIDALTTRTIVMLLAVGAGVSEGEFVNRVQALSSVTGLALSGEATATVRVVPDPTFDCTDVLGKVFDDANRNGVQDEGEAGLPGVRLMTVRGLAITTDPHGRFHITCAVVPNEERGSNYVLKLDDRTLPSGYRMTTRQTQVRRATRGKALRFQFGAAIHRVVGLDLADPVFEPGATTIRGQWLPRIERLVDELAKADSILRLSYVADVEAKKLVERRLEAIESKIREAWAARGGGELVVETEIFWRRGGPPEQPRTPNGTQDTSALESSLPHVGAGPPGWQAPLGEAGERHLPTDEPITQWSVDPELLDQQFGDRLEEREVVKEKVETVKLANVVPPIRFASGVADISPGTVERLRVVLEGMQHLENVRLHLVGHADDRPLSPELAARYRDNEGLSRERAGEVAEFLARALDLPPESISYAWAGAASPIASNGSEAGRALNRRVEVEVWYDQRAEVSAVEEVVIPQDWKRVKVCRTETVCKVRYREGHERRARVRNLVPPLPYGDEIVEVPADFVRQVEEAFRNLSERRNVTAKFVAYTDDIPLAGRDERLYGTHLAISKARARRVALEVQERLGLPSRAVASEGRGDARPLASNATPRGRALNRRVEVEFWYDDALLEIPDELQVCPEAGEAELVTRVYDPPWGRFEPIPVEEGEAKIPSDLAGQLERAMGEIAGRENVRLRFVGYAANERLTRRQAEVYGDDIGLSAARARRAMERIQAQLELPDARVEHEGRGFVQSEDVVNTGFIQGETSYVIAEVVYDEPAVLDDYEGLEITPVTRELRPSDPLALNLMRITVDGEPIDDPARSSADIQRCTDVALEDTDIQFRFDDLDGERRLSLSSTPDAVAGGEPVLFRMYTNYAHWIERAEVRIFDLHQSLKDEPLAVVELDRRGLARWLPSEALESDGPKRALRLVLRAYGEKGRFDETAPQSLWLLPDRAEPLSLTDVFGLSAPLAEAPLDPAEAEAGAEAELPASRGAGAPSDGKGADDSGAGRADDADGGTDGAPGAGGVDGAGGATSSRLLAGYGESEAIAQNIEIGNAGTVRVTGHGVPEGHSVWLAGSELPVDDEGNFVGEVLLPKGLHTVEVAVLDEEGNGELYLRDLEVERDDWFFVGIADLTLSADLAGDRPKVLGGNNGSDTNAFANGRLAFYTTGKFGEDWKLTATADTREGPVEDLFTNFLDKSPQSLFRRLDPDYYYPTFGDDSSIEETAPTLGKFYVKLSKRDSHLLWGNFTVRYRDNELALVERGLYGGNARYRSDATTRFGERRFVVDGFAADPGTIPSREDFRGTGGSVYFLKRQDLLVGSERLRVEVRDKATGIVSEVITLQPQLDYDIDYIQGRVLLSEPLSAIVGDELLVRNDGLSGNEAWLVVQYEYTPGFDSVNTLNVGGQAHAWITDFLKIGATASHNQNEGVDSSLYAADLTLRKSPRSWIKLQAARSEGVVSTAEVSGDGGYTFTSIGDPGFRVDDAYAYRADVAIGFADLLGFGRGELNLYGQRREAGYTAPGLATPRDVDQYGALLRMPVLDTVHVTAKGDRTVEDRGLTTLAAELDVEWSIGEFWSVDVGARHDEREDDSPVVVATQEEGDRTDAVVQIEFDPKARWRTWIFGQGTLRATGDRPDNHRGGVGGELRVNDRISVDGEVSHGDLGPAAKVGTAYQHSERTNLYMNYALDNERGFDGLHERRGSLVLGTRSRFTDSASVYVENQYQHSRVTGLTRSMGVTYAPTERWTFDVNWEDGTTRDRRTSAETERRAGGGRVGYRFDRVDVSTGVEYVFNQTQQSDGSRSDRTTWLFRNNLKVQMTEDWRLLAKFNHAISDSSQGSFFDGGFTEAVLGYAYRPIAHDRLDALVKYTYFYNVPAVDQVGQNGTAAQFIQKSHIASIDVTYDLTKTWSIGGKYAFRRSQVSVDRDDPDFFDNDAHLYILRADWRFLENWEGTLEGRMLDLPDLDERRAGALTTLYRYFGDHLKAGIGYNFTDFSEDLTDLSYDHHGIFFNVVGSF
ncbi:MAG: DUF11 domain-containing protein [Myxococcales bacterium]|nr:DUF11 domain-containing protein [Myxococcales bacterium]